MADASTLESDRRDRVLDAALKVFGRFGFRKTSMDEVARAADISRQGLYFLFRDKEALFRESLTKMMVDGLARVDAELAADAPIDERLIGAIKAWYGRFVGAMGENADELFARSVDLVGDLMQRYGDTVLERLTAAIDGSPLAGELARRGVTPADAARTLHYCGLGLKHDGISRAEFTTRLTAAVRLVIGRPGGEPLTPTPRGD
jgi:TetR/AcrR family transcriptional regulator of autoinduction and epiphytic fitness